MQTYTIIRVQLKIERGNSMSNDVVVQPKQRGAMMIKNLCPGLMEMGKIKIGNKGAVRKSQSGNDWQAPQKLDHFLVTTMQRGADNNFLLDEFIHKQLGDAPKSIPVRLIYDDISLNFATRYICYYGKTVFCSGDGESAQRLQKDGTTKTIACTCGRQDPKYTGDDGPAGPEGLGGKNSKGKCKINGILSVIIDGAMAVGGVWKFRTTSYNSVVGILSSLALIQRITGGRLAGIPMNMTVSPKTVQDPIAGNQQTIYVVGLQYAGTVESLREVGYEIAMVEAKHGISMARIEHDAMLMLSHVPAAGLGDDLASDVVDEFYPEEARDVPDLVDAAPGVDQPQGVEAQGTPPLASVTIEGEQVDTSTGEVTETEKPAAPARERGKASPGKKRRTDAEIEEDRLADEADYKAAQEIKPVTEPLTTERAGLIDDDNFPDPPGTVAAQVGLEAAADDKTAEAGEDMGDLF